MSHNKYSLGIDYGTLSGRAVLADVKNGEIIGDLVVEYPHAVIDTRESVSQLVGRDVDIVPSTALQHPDDYLLVLRSIPKLLGKTGVNAEDVVGIGIDFTSCTPMPVKSDGTPLCFIDEYRSDIHAYVKLWKHHGATAEADAMNANAPEGTLDYYGGSVSCEQLLPKLWEIKHRAPHIYDACDLFVEAGDWVIRRLTGKWVGSTCMAGYKVNRTKEDGYPTEWIKRCEGIEDAESKLLCDIREPGTSVGTLTAEAAAMTGLAEGTPVSAAIIDAHACVPGAGISEEGKLLGIIGTSACYMLLSSQKHKVGGICGMVDGGIIPGFYGYEAGQSCMGDHFEWFIENCVPKSYYDEAEAKGVSIHTLLCDKASQLAPGSGTAESSPLIALDWWNGNRSVLCDHTLTGTIVGLTLGTRPEQIYRALIEATAYGARMIIEAFRSEGVTVDELYVTGGIPQKNKLLDQIYADVLGIPVKLAACTQCGALGAAMLGAAASGVYGTVGEAINAMGAGVGEEYYPNRANTAKYDKLFDEYKILHDYFGRGANDVMKRLRTM